uniref:Uncharacterized protein MANES_07G046900 n=1 Tax=Rhizophora mucronata TaxID=61149 RepID=A0A2P2KG51_RHIMU
MESCSYSSYPDSEDSSPIDFESPMRWEDQQQPPQNNNNYNYKVKFMCSYGGKIHPRPHDNQLSYIGGETKILAVDRATKFSVMMAKLAALCGDTDVSFKYQLPGEDLDALISVTNDDDLEHMMHEYDRLYRASGKPARMRLFLFPVNPSLASFGSDGGKSDRDRFIEALNSGPAQVAEGDKMPADLLGLEKGAPSLPPRVKVPDLPDVPAASASDDRVIGSDQITLQAPQIRDLEQQAMYKNKSDENLAGAFAAGDYFLQKLPEKVSPATMPVSVPPVVTAPASYWPEKQIASGGYHATVTTTATPVQAEQQVYMIPAPAPATVYHNPAMRPVTGNAGQGYYMQRMGVPEVYREAPMYNVIPPQQQQPPLPQMSVAGPMGMVRPSGPGIGMTDAGYAQVGYDSAGWQVLYSAAGGGVVQPPPPYQGVAGVAVSGEMRPVPGGVGPLGHDGKVVTKVSQGSV